MCKYCEKQKTLKEKYFDITIVNNCLVVGNECSEGCGYDRSRFNINYCPMCGRNLGGQYIMTEEEKQAVEDSKDLIKELNNHTDKVWVDYITKRNK